MTSTVNGFETTFTDSSGASVMTTYVDGVAVMQSTATTVVVQGQAVFTSAVIHEGTPVQGGATYTVDADDTRIDCQTAEGAINIVLPTANSATDRTITILDIAGNAATNNVTVTVASNGKINGASSYVISTNYGAVTLISASKAWIVADKVVQTGSAVSMNITPSGAIDGYNTLYSTPAAFSQITLYLNGVYQTPGVDYTVVGPTTIQTVLAPTGGSEPDVLRCDIVLT